MNANDFDYRCWDACRSGNVDEVKKLRTEGFELSATIEHNGHTPLCTALWNGHIDLLRYLLEKGVEPHSVNPVGGGDFPPLTVAANQGVCKAVELLLTHGADPNLLVPVTGETALHAATCKAFNAEATEIVRLLLAAGADPNCKTNAGFKSGTYDGGGVTFVEETPLHLAAAYGPREMIQLLVEAGADVQAQDKNGDTPLVWFGRHQRRFNHVRLTSEEKTWELLQAP